MDNKKLKCDNGSDFIKVMKLRNQKKESNCPLN